jgi:protein TonB
VKALIDEKGKVVETIIAKGVSPELDNSAAKAVKGTKFKPGKVKGHAVKAQVILPVAFTLQ